MIFDWRRRLRSYPDNSQVITLPDTAHRPTLYLDNSDNRDQVAHALRSNWAGFEPPLPAVLHTWLQRNSGLVIDVGANTGYYSLLAAVSAPDNRVVAFEPDKPVFARLETNIRLNGLERRVAAHPVALSDHSGIGTLYVPSQEHGLVDTSSSLERTFTSKHSELRKIAVTTLDEFLRRLKYRWRPVTLLKIDVEGHEAAVLRGAIETIRRWRPIMFVEILPAAEVEYLRRFVHDLNYLDFPLSADQPPCPAHAVEFHPSAWNHALVPTERVALFQSLWATNSDFSLPEASPGVA